MTLYLPRGECRGVDERLIELLGVYGLSDRESQIFIFLTKNGACGAGELAKGVGIRRMEAYRLLKRLLDRGVVVSTAGKPIKYQAEGLEGVVSLLTDEQRGKVRNMDEAKAELSSLWKGIPRAPKESFEQRFRIVQGREQIYNAMAKMAETAVESLDLVLTRNDVVQAHVLGLGDKLVEASKRGVRVGLIAPVDPVTVEAVQAVIKSVEVRHSQEVPRSRLAIADGVQTLVSLVLDDTRGVKNERDIAIWTDSKDYAETMEGLYRSSFAKAADAREKLAEVKGAMKFQEKASGIVGVVRTALSEAGWKVDAPGKLVGASGGEFEFAAVLSGPSGEKTALEVVFPQRDGGGERVTAAALKKLDLGEGSLVIVSTPLPDEQTIGLARLLGVNVVDGSDAVSAAASVRSLVLGPA